MGLNDPLNEVVKYDDKRYRIIGVVEDFYHESFYNEVTPMVFVMTEPEQMRYLVIQSTDDDLLAVNEFLESEWKKVAPDDPYSGVYQADVFGSFFQENRANIAIMSFVSSLTLILACIGLFGLVSFTIQRRMKEFSIRKVMGASLKSIARLINADYIWVLLIAFVVGIPLSVFMMINMTSSIYADPKPVDPAPVVLAVVIMVATVVITVSSQVLRVSRNNPADTLRDE